LLCFEFVEFTLFTNPRPVQWGTAPVLVRASTREGQIKVKASVVFQGKHTPLSGELVIRTRPSAHPLIADENEQKQLELHGQQVSSAALSGTSGSVTNERRQQELNLQKLKEVEQQQSDFE